MAPDNRKPSWVKAAAFGLFILALAGPAAKLLAAKDDWYTQHYIIMQDFERKAYKKLSAEGKQEFQKLFWAARAPESKEEFLKRMNYVTINFKKENSRQPWNTDRSRIHLLNGIPASIDYRQNDNWAMSIAERASGGNISTNTRTNEDVGASTAEVWSYPYDKYIIIYSFAFRSPNEWRMSPGIAANNRYQGDLETQSKEMTFGVLDIDQYKKDLENLKTFK